MKQVLIKYQLLMSFYILIMTRDIMMYNACMYMNIYIYTVSYYRLLDFFFFSFFFLNKFYKCIYHFIDVSNITKKILVIYILFVIYCNCNGIYYFIYCIILR